MKTTRHLLVKNTIWLSLLEVISKIIMFFVTISVIRYFGANEFGRLNYAQAFVGIVMLLSDFGLNTILIRDIARDKKRASSYLASAMRVKGISAVLVFIVLFLVTSSDVSLFMLMGAFLLTQSLESLYTAVLTAYESMELIFVARLVHYLGILGSVGLVIAFHLGLNSLLCAYIASAVLSIFVSVYFLRKLSVSLFAPHDRSLTGRLLRESLPIFGSLAISQAYFNMDTVMIRHFQGVVEVGYYQAAYKILYAFLAINLVASVTYPRISALYHKKQYDQLKRLAQVVLYGGSLILIPFIILMYVYNPMIINAIYGASYAPSAAVLPVLLTAGLLMFYRTFIGNYFLATGRQVVILCASFVALLVNLSLNYFLIPRFGFVQAGISLVASESALLLILLLTFRRSRI